MGRLGRIMEKESENYRDSCRFDRSGAAFDAAKRRKALTLREFAELLADVDPNKLSRGYAPDDCLYDQEVNPYLMLLIDWIEVEDLTPPNDDDIPF